MPDDISTCRIDIVTRLGRRWSPCRLIAVLGIMSIASSCNLVPPGQSELVIHVDSVTGPTAVSGSVAFESRLWGHVGPDGCWSFKELRTTRVAAQVDVTVIGQHIDGAGPPGIACLDMPVALDGVMLRVDPIVPNPFAIIVHEPDGSTIVRKILAE